MWRITRFLFLIFVTFFMSLSLASASIIGVFSLKQWGQASYEILPNALDSFGQAFYYGSSDPSSSANYLYASYVSSGSLAWKYNTGLPVNYVSNFSINGNAYVIAGTGGSTFSGLLQQSYVIARSSDNRTLWQSINLNSSVESLGSTESSIIGNEDVVAGLENGTIIRLSGNNGTIIWRYSGVGSLSPRPYDIFQLNNESFVVGTRDSGYPYEGHIYCFKNGALCWENSSAPSNPLTLVERFGDVNNDGVPDVIAVFSDAYIHVFDGATGKSMGSPWPFHVGDLVSSLLCSQDYTGDGFPDIVAGTRLGRLMIINGRNGTLVRGPITVGSTVAYVNYMYSYESGGTYSLNKTLAVSLLNSAYVPIISGVNASDLTTMENVTVPGGVVAQNLFSIGNYTSPYTGDLLFTAGTADNVVYFLSGTDIIFPEFSSQVVFIFLVVTVGFCVAISRRRRS
jgi:hypothetical protein